MDWDKEYILDQIINSLNDKIAQLEENEQPEQLPFTYKSDEQEKLLSRALLNELSEKYKNKTLEQLFDGQIVENNYGKFFRIQDSLPFSLKLMDLELAQEKLVNDLKLVFGIKHAREQQLKSEGFKTLYHLLDHPQYGRQADRVVQILETRDINQIQNLIKSRYGSWSAHIAFYLSAFYNAEDFLFFDIETMGLFHRAIILIGLAYIRQNNLIVEQYLLTDYEDEPAALFQTLEKFREAKALISFNGRRFDYNYINQRLTYNFLEPLPELPHFDLLHFSANQWDFLPDKRLKTIERHILDIRRHGDLPSDMVPEFYNFYIENNNPGPLIPIIEHNRQDLITLAKLFGELHRQISLSE